ncbi:expressed unknown protein [Seminavis robusta]|uniref:Uncharacterized protein n=1 Tax=Seminavis robusta TaxID=568900 RepID=A0A9N8HXA6_9STRA|nr:expressed unknown protein [Seminavis robusta]CAB9529107.1 expressed unknown protein [Seminavis robusta]|eukprot:Sro1266_g257530.1 n/a (101) ;mRNA; f:49-351
MPSDKKKSKDKKIKKSGVRTKFLIESLRQEYYDLRSENDMLRGIVEEHLPKDVAGPLLAECFDPTSASSKVSSIDDLANKMSGVSTKDDDSDDEDDAVGF